MSETSGATAADSSGNSLTATWNGTYTRNVTGLIASDPSSPAVSISGSGYAQIAYNSLMNVTSLWVEAVIKPAAIGSTMQIVDRDSGTGDRIFQFRITSTGKLEVLWWTSSAGPFGATGTTTLSAGSIYHVAALLDGSTGKVLVGGVVDATTTQSGSLKTPGLSQIMRIGAGADSGITNKFNGTIQDVAFGPVITVARVQAHVAAMTSGALSGSPADAVGVTDSATFAVDFARSPADSVGVTDTVSAVITRTMDDAVGITDSVTADIGLVGSASDLVGVTDSVSVTADVARTPSDAVGVTDSVSKVVTASITVADPVAVSDAPSSSGSSGYSQAPSDAVGITDSATYVFVPGAPPAVVKVPNPTQIKVGGQRVSLGSLWMPYPVSSSGSQVLDFSIVPTDPEAPWPFPWEGDGYSNSLWLAFDATATQTLTLTLATTFDAGIEVWTGIPTDDAEDISSIGYGQGTLEVAIAPGERILMRAHPLSDTETGSGTLTWSVATRAETGVLGFVVQAQLLETPGWLDISLLSAAPDSDVTLALDGGAVFYTVHTEENGTFAGSVEVPELTVGTHTITAVDSDGQTETESFEVMLEPQTSTLPGGGGPTTGISVDPVIHWVLEDPMPSGLGAYTFPINPAEMSSPWPLKALRVEHTIHGSGQDVIWEGRPDPVDWTAKGTVRTQEFYETLEAYQALNRRIFVIDHHQRAWVVAFDGLTFEKKGSPGDLWFYSYTAKFKILGGPVDLT